MNNPARGINASQRRGSIGESLVEAKLKSFAQVSRPTSLQEFGLDIYCRLLNGNIPSNIAFYVEVKTTESLNNSWTKSMPKQTIDFWLGQHFPVFIVVCDESTEKCYWISVEDNRESWITSMTDKNASIGIKVDKANELRKDYEQNSQFIQKIQNDFIRVNANNGIAEFISRGYLGHFPILKLSEEARWNVRGRIRNGFNYLFNDCLLVNNFQGAYEYCQQLANFDKGHYDHFLTLARICIQLGKKEEAEKNYDLAIDICRHDPTWNSRIHPGEPKIEEIIAEIQQEKIHAIAEFNRQSESLNSSP